MRQGVVRSLREAGVHALQPDRRRDRGVPAHVIRRVGDCLGDSPGEPYAAQLRKTVASKNLDGIYPPSWMFYQGRWHSYEYKRYAVAQPLEPFVADLG